MMIELSGSFAGGGTYVPLYQFSTRSRMLESMGILRPPTFDITGWRGLIAPVRVDGWVRAQRALDLDLEAKLNIATSLPTANAPIFFGYFSKQYFHMIFGNSEWFKVAYD